MHFRFTMVALMALILLAWCHAVTRAQEGHFGKGHEDWHEEFYSKLVNPYSHVSCCSKADCRPTSGRTVSDHLEVKVDGQWVEVLPKKIIKETSPSGGYHVCAPKLFDGNPDHIYCVVVPLEARHGASFKQARN